MYGIRNKNTKEYLKINYEEYELGERYHLLTYAKHCIEINYYVSTTLGFVATVLKQEGNPYVEYEPLFDASVDTSELEVVDLTENKVIDINVVLDGYDDKTIPENNNKLEFDDEIEFEIEIENIEE